MPSEPDLVKIAIPAPEDAREMYGVRIEYVWAEPLGGELFRIDNIPFYSDDVCADDIVLANAPSDETISKLIDGTPVYQFRAVHTPSGNATAIVLALGIRDPSLPLETDPSYSPFAALHDAVCGLGCTYEGADREPCYLTAINIPPDVQRALVVALLDRGSASGHWVYTISGDPRIDA